MNKPQTGQTATETGTGEMPSWSPIREAVSLREKSAAASKCWPCDCLHNSLKTIERAPARRGNLETALQKAREHLQEVFYACLGCAVCYPALAGNAFQESVALPDGNADVFLAESLKPRPGCDCNTTCEEEQ